MHSDNALIRTFQCICSVLMWKTVYGQEPSVLLNQGAIIGVKIFPESSRVGIDAYLGIPYATAPVGRLRFSAPEKHKGWKRTLYAQEFGPQCLQLGGDQRPGGKPRSEDCLYLNVWVPENAQRIGSLPVVLILHSETFGEDASLQLPGQDLAAEGLVVITANYRLNVFGFYCMEMADARGNLALLDQYFAMLWIKENIDKFGGDPAAVTLLGHSAGATSVLYHIASPRTKSLFSKAILMSGSVSSAWAQSRVIQSSRLMTSLLGCLSDNPKDSVTCMRERPVDDILKAFKSQSQNGNWTNTMVPTVDKFLPKNDQYLPSSVADALSSGNFNQIPILTGLTSVEAADSREHWEDLARQGYHQLRHYVDFTAIPSVMAAHKLNVGPNAHLVKEMIRWEYAERANEGDAWTLLRQLQLLYTEAQYEAPHARMLAHLIKTTQPLYVYRFVQAGGVDLHAKKSNASGAAHGSDLPYLLGPTLFQQLTRRRLTQQEERLSKRMRIMWSEFVKFGYPMSGRQYDAWRMYTEQDPAVYQIGESNMPQGCQRKPSYWNKFLPTFANLTKDRDGRSLQKDKQVGYGSNDTIKHAMYTLLGLVIALLILLVVCVVLLKRSAKERQRGRDMAAF